MSRIRIGVGFALLVAIALFYFVTENARGDTGSASFASANYLGLAAVIVGIAATIFIFRRRVHPPR